MADESADFHENDTPDADNRDIDDTPDADNRDIDDTPDDDGAEPADADDPVSHLAEIPDGAGCTEIREHLSAGRDE